MKELPAWFQLLTVFAWVLSGVSAIIHWNIRKKHRRGIRYQTIRLERSLRDAKLSFSQTSASYLLNVFSLLYGDNWRRRLLASALLSTTYTLFVLGYAYFWDNYFLDFRAEKTSIERAVDSFLYDMPIAEREHALEKVELRTTKEGYAIIGYRHTDKKSRKIQSRVSEFPSKYREKISQSANRDAIAMLWLLEGTYLAQGPEFESLVFLLIFNLLVDLSAYFITFSLLKRMSQTNSLKLHVLASLLMSLGALLLFFMTLLPYGELTTGNTAIFRQLLIDVPFTIALILSLFVGGIALLSRDEGCCLGIVAIPLGLFLTYVESYRVIANYDLTFPQFAIDGHLNYVPYLLSLSAIVPLVICAVSFSLLVLIRISGESGRNLTYWYLKAVNRMNQPTLVVLSFAPAAVLELFSRIASIYIKNET